MTVWVTVLVLVLVLMLVLTLGSVVVVVVVVVGSVVVVVVVCSVVVGAAVVVAVVVVGAVADVVVRVIGVSVVGGVSGDVPPVRSLTRPKMINAISTGRERRMQRARRVCDTRGAVLLAAGPVAARAADRSRRSWRTRSARREGSAVVRRSVARHGHR